MRELMDGGGAADADVEAELGSQPLRTPQDWWTVIMGSGHRWTVDQLAPDTRRRLRDANLDFIRINGITEVATNVIYAIARKSLR